MEKFNRQEFILRIILLGVSIGLLILALFYWLVFSVSGEVFLFAFIWKLHASVPAIYLVDALPLMLGILFWYVARKRAIQLNNLHEQVRNITTKKEEIKSFTNKLIAGLFTSEIRFSGEDMDLSDTLMNLQNKLSANLEAERKLRLEDRQRNYISGGLAEFGDILRTHANNMETLSYAVISNLVKYLGANQGGFFLVDRSEERKTIRMIACYAYDRKKFPDKVLEWGEGLIGAVALEKKSIYTDKIPDSYLTITSGLGKANPKYLYITACFS
ncbi:MAG TPA: hypothetical protein ENO01_02855 [Candidatus Marinimicrobia bacterium]|nr:hypothetical protein [Candidatus Neomarinimicrobiota bacterium]